MKKLLILLVLSLRASGQTLTIEEMNLYIGSTFTEDTKLLKAKGFIFFKNHEDFAGTRTSVFIKKNGKDTTAIGLLNNNVKVWGVKHIRITKPEYLSLKKQALDSGHKLDKTTKDTENGERYAKPDAGYFIFYNYNMNSLSVMGETFWVTYQNSKVNKK